MDRESDSIHLVPHTFEQLLGGGNLTVIKVWFGQVYGVYRHFQQYYSYIVTVSFIGEGIRSTWGKPPTYRKSLTNFIT